MIVKILSSSASFKGVSYNTDKIDRGKGELMRVANFGPLQALQNNRPEDYKLYLKMLSARNKRVHFPQFHAVISAPGKAYDKYALTQIAGGWLKEMGYGNQPYLVVFHKDTGNNHVHIVTTRIDRDGKKISSGFENIRAIGNLNKVLGVDEKHSAAEDLKRALGFRYSTVAQFKMLLEQQGYVLKDSDGQIDLVKFGLKQAGTSYAEINNKLYSGKHDAGRISEVRAIFNKYAQQYSTALSLEKIALPSGIDKPGTQFVSDFSEYLKQKHGLVLIFHSSAQKPPYGYSVIDHSGKAVYKGSEIIPLKALLAIEAKTGNREKENEPELGRTFGEPGKDSIQYYKALLKAAMYNYPDVLQGLHHQGLNINLREDDWILTDYACKISVPVSELLDESEYRQLAAELRRSREMEKAIFHQFHSMPSVSLVSDIDDEAIHGRNRRRKRKSRTNTR
jgi:hypothetical protein